MWLNIKKLKTNIKMLVAVSINADDVIGQI